MCVKLLGGGEELKQLRLCAFHKCFLYKRTDVQNSNSDQSPSFIQLRRDIGTQFEAACLFIFGDSERKNTFLLEVGQFRVRPGLYLPARSWNPICCLVVT